MLKPINLARGVTHSAAATFSLRALTHRIGTIAFFGTLACVLVGCGGGTDTSGSSTSPAATFVISPDTVQLSSGDTVTLQLVSGRRPFTMVTSSSSALTITPDLDNSRIALTGGLVAVDTTIAVTVRDAGNALATTTVKVLPGAFALLPTDINVNGYGAAELLVRGGRAPYTLLTDSPGLITFLGGVESGRLAFFAAQVAAETAVKITVLDSVGLTSTANVKIKPSALTREITLEALPGPGTDGQVARCQDGTTVCAGGFARVAVKLTGSAGPVSGRPLKFDVRQGKFSFATDSAITQFGSAVTLLTDSAGVAQATLRADADATTQPAILQVTDVLSGDVRVYAFSIGGRTLSVIPNKLAFVGPRIGICGSGEADVAIYGGAPPYRVDSPLGVSVNPRTVLRIGDRFRVTVSTTGSCLSTQTFQAVVTDAQGVGLPVSIEVSQGTTSEPPIVVAPSSLTLNSCSASAGAVFTGTINNFAGAAELSVLVGSGNITVSVARGAKNGTYATAFTNGISSATLSATLTNLPTTGCP